MNTLYW